MENPPKVNFYNGYEYVGEWSTEVGECDKCGSKQVVITCDQNKLEYQPGRMCKKCVLEMFSAVGE